MPKSWSRGLTAATDARVARMAERRRGMRYVSHLPPELDRRRTSAPVDRTWSETLAYAVGLIATDGCLAGGKTISFNSADRELVVLLLECLAKRNRVVPFKTKWGTIAYRTQIGDVAFHRWLESIGITPRKSLTIGSIDVPDMYLLPLVRGLLDGDGSIINGVTRADSKDAPGYLWEYLQTKFVSGSHDHLAWLQDRLATRLGPRGYLHSYRTGFTKSIVWELRYGKRESIQLLKELYADETAPRLQRKWTVWRKYVDRHRLSAPPRIGTIEPKAQVE